MQGVALTSEELRKLLSCGCPDAVSLFLYRKAGQPLETALDALHFTVPQMVSATDCLRQLGMWESPVKQPLEPERPVYTDEHLQLALRSGKGKFSKLVGEAQRRLGRTLSTEELKTLLSFTDYLRLPTDVVGLLLSYCIERSRRRGTRVPSMRNIEREAYRWADEEIDTLETASFYVQSQLEIHTRIQQLRIKMQLDGRRLTATEEQYLASWIQMGFPDASILLAFERTCVQANGFNWKYMNSILKSWHEKGLHSLKEIRSGDTVPVRGQAKTGKQYQHHGDELTPLAKKAVQQALADGQEG
ncbi:MAG: DnaD domain protein [Oscillospiraceae bacterium]|nr:DnaD domain protein [Oscillospiraceae bacterium]